MIQAPGSWFDLIEMSFRSVKNLAKCLCYSSELCPNFPSPRRTWSTTPRWTTTEPGLQRVPPTGPSRFSKSRRVLRPGLLISEVTRDPSGRWGAQRGCGESYSGWKTTLLTSVFFVRTSVSLASWYYADGIDIGVEDVDTDVRRC